MWRPSSSPAPRCAISTGSRSSKRSGVSPESGWRSGSVTLRPEAVQARLLRLEEVIGQLQELGRLDLDTLRRNLRDIWAAERGLQLGAEILFDIGNHIL